MRVVVVGGSGHVGTFLVPRLVRAGHEVITISRGGRTGYIESLEWQQVQQVVADRQHQDAEGVFGDTVAKLRPDVVVDLVCFTVESATALVERLRGEISHLLHCGSLWRYGPSTGAPIAEGEDTAPVGEYGTQKDRIARMLKAETRAAGLATTSLHPGHIVGPGWAPIGPVGNLDPAVWQTLSAGRPLRVPGLGAELMHHVHADDVAQAFDQAIAHPDTATGQDFNIAAPTALNVRGLAHEAARWFGQTAQLETVSWDQFRATTTDEHAQLSWEHLHRSHCLTIDKAQRLLGYTPAYTPEAAVLESVRWLIDHHQLDVEHPLVV